MRRPLGRSTEDSNWHAQANIRLRLMTYASAEAVELGLAQSLNGDPSHDSPILAMLVSDVTTGIQLNMNNTLLVSSHQDLVRRLS